MANLILSEAQKLFEVSRFTGINHLVSGGTRVCRNFRIRPNGALEKRDGYMPVTILPGLPRAVWCGNVFGEEKLFCLVDNVVYETDCSDEGSIELGSVSTVDGRADFFYCRGGLYLVDGEDIYSVSRNGVERESGYVPVYGRDWTGISPGKVNEPVNFLSDRIIVHFKLMDVSLSYLELGIKCSEILKCTLNGVPYDGAIELANGGMRIKLSGMLPEECEMCFLLRLDSSLSRRGEIKTVTSAVQSGGDRDSRVLLFSGENKSRLFALREISDGSYATSLSMAPDSSEIYFPVSDSVTYGDGREEVRTAVSLGSKTFIFTNTGTWLGDFTGKSVPKVSRINDRVGCLALHGAVAGKYVYSIMRQGIFRWEPSSNEGFRPVCISEPISDMLSEMFPYGAVAHYVPQYGEVWFADPDSEDRCVFVYCEETGNWYTFDPIPSDRFFTLSGRTVMLSGKYLLDFPGNFHHDITLGDMEPAGAIKAEYSSGDLDLGLSAEHKRVRRVMSESYLDGEGLEIAVNGNRMKRPAVVRIDNVTNRKITYSDRRINTGRFKRMNFSVTACGRGKVRVDRLIFAVFK